LEFRNQILTRIFYNLLPAARKPERNRP